MDLKACVWLNNVNSLVTDILLLLLSFLSAVVCRGVYFYYLAPFRNNENKNDCRIHWVVWFQKRGELKNQRSSEVHGKKRSTPKSRK